jgi:hypothetical protein
MTEPKRMDIRIRFQPYPHHQLGQTLLYMQLRGYDPTQEAENLLISRFLPFALKEQIERDPDCPSAAYVAQVCIGRLSGTIQAIREVYQLQPSTAGVPSNTEALAIAHECIGQLSGVIQSIQALYQLQPPARLGEDEEESEPEPEQRLKAQRDPTQDDFLCMFGGDNS